MSHQEVKLAKSPHVTVRDSARCEEVWTSFPTSSHLVSAFLLSSVLLPLSSHLQHFGTYCVSSLNTRHMTGLLFWGGLASNSNPGEAFLSVLVWCFWGFNSYISATWLPGQRFQIHTAGMQTAGWLPPVMQPTSSKHSHWAKAVLNALFFFSHPDRVEELNLGVVPSSAHRHVRGRQWPAVKSNHRLTFLFPPVLREPIWPWRSDGVFTFKVTWKMSPLLAADCFCLPALSTPLLTSPTDWKPASATVHWFARE